MLKPIGFAILGPLVTISGCATLDADDDARGARLPTGVTLLDSERDQCEGTIQVEERRATSSRGAEIVLRQGQNATFAIAEDADDDDIEWTCIGESASDRETVDCPDDTSHVRIVREAQGDDFLLECYGDRSDG